MDCYDFLELAKKLQNSDDEASLRTAVSRSYYAIFNHVKEFLDKNGIPLPKAAQAHEKARLYILNCGIDKAADLADSLDNLRDKRNDADYELRTPKFLYNKKNCGLASFQAEKFLKEFKNLDPSEFLTGIRAYKAKTNN